ncbi:MAG: hypothetical protein ABIQ86_07010 [Steroidobacteraceae bacterium]
MRKYIALGTLMALGVGGSAVAAEGFSYNNLEVSYVLTEVDALNLEGDGFAIGGSVAFNDHVFGFSSINDIDYDSGSGISISVISLGVGFNWAVAQNLDLVSGLSYEHLKLKISGVGSASDDGVGVNVGLRGRLGDRVELTSGVKYSDFGHDVNDFTWSIGGRYYFTRNFAAGIDLSDNDDGTSWNFALRYDFGMR